MTRDLAINARFLTQRTTGVQRFAAEMTAALGQLGPKPVLLAPGATQLPDSWRERGWRLRAETGVRGNAWEQLILPFLARGSMLINLANTAPLLRRRQVVVIHDAGVFATPEAYSWKFRAWYRWLHRRLARGGTLIATVSEFSRGEIERCLGVPRGGIAVVGEGAEHILRPPRVVPPLARGSYALAVGTPAAHKNLAALGKTAAMLRARGLDLVAAGGVAGNVFGAAAWPGGIRPLGRVDDATLAALYRGATCLLFPSRYEGFGLPAIEAMACGCPVIAASIPALREVCGDAALFAAPDDPKGFATAAARLLDEPSLARHLRDAGQARAARFTWQAAAENLLGAIARA